MSFENSDYFKSEEHLINAKNASIEGNKKIQELKQARIDEYSINPKKCKLCDKPLDYHHQKRTFCSSSCSASFNNEKRVLSDKTKEKISHQLKGKIHDTERLSIQFIDKTCPNCDKAFKTRKKNQVYCSRECVRKKYFNSESSKEKTKQKVKERIENGTFSGWKSRKNRNPSYPENYFIDLLNNENITGWTRELPMDKYFIDFAFIDKKVALEIDGKQHSYEDRKKKDIEKDMYLKENGWNVFRIKWYNPVNDKNKEKLYSQIDIFKEILH